MKHAMNTAHEAIDDLERLAALCATIVETLGESAGEGSAEYRAQMLAELGAKHGQGRVAELRGALDGE